MHSLYNIVSGPLAWLAFAIFIGGSIYRLISLMVLVNKKEPFIFSYMSLKYSLRSILRWSTPFATENMRKHPALTIVAFAFHIFSVANGVLHRRIERKPYFKLMYEKINGSFLWTNTIKLISR